MTKLFALLLTGCSAVSAVAERTGPEFPPKPPNAPVAAYFTAAGQTPPRPYVQVGVIRVDSIDSPGAVLAAAGERARELGADAMLVDFRWHWSSLPVTMDPTGAPHVPPTPRLNANIVAVRFAQ